MFLYWAEAHLVRHLDKDGKELPVMISAAVGRGGETMISAQTTEAFWNAVRHVKPGEPARRNTAP